MSEYLWCTCIGPDRKRGFVAYPDLDSKLWVHAPCKKPARMVLEKLTALQAPRGAQYLLSVHGTYEGTFELVFECNDREKKVVIQVAGAPGVVLKMWEKLDEAMTVIMEPPGDPEKHAAKIRARAFAEIISDCMQSFYPTPDDVAREAMARYKDESRETPGLADDKLTTNGVSSGGLKTTVKLPPEVEAGIKNALQSGAFSVEQLAELFKVSVETVESLQ